MATQQYDIPILLIIFKRKDFTQRLFNIIRQLKPTKLYVTADGPRNQQEALLVEQTRQVIKIDWECDAKLFFHDKNLGVAGNPVFGINQMLSENPYGIILEDDILPSKSFFPFMQQLLKKYQDDPEVGYITGANPFSSNTSYSYSFVDYAFTIGWATWKRVWQGYDFEIRKWGEIDRRKWLKERFKNPLVRLYWYDFFTRFLGGSSHSWDYQFSFLNFDNRYKAIVPSKSLAAHIGIDEHATHQSWLFDFHKLTKLEELDFPLHHPPSKEINVKLNRQFTYVQRRLMAIKLLTRPWKYWPMLLKVL